MLIITRKEEMLKEQIIDIADMRKVISVAITRKKNTAKDAISNVVEGKFG